MGLREIAGFGAMFVALARACIQQSAPATPTGVTRPGPKPAPAHISRPAKIASRSVITLVRCSDEEVVVLLDREI